MAPFQPPVMTDDDGHFAIALQVRFQHLYAITSDHKSGGIVFADTRLDSPPELKLRVRPLIQVGGQMESSVHNKEVDWSHV